MGKIEQFQIRKIYAIGHALGIVSSGSGGDELHVMVAGMTGKSSIKELTCKEAGNVITRLEGLRGKPASPKPFPQKGKVHPERPGGVTSGQQKKIWALMYELKKHDAAANHMALGERLSRIIKKEIKMDAAAKDPFVWMDFAQGNKLIEVLKKYVESARRKGQGETDGVGIQ